MESVYDRIPLYKLDKKSKEEIIKKLKKVLAKKERVKLAIVFGSLTTREYIRDIDVCIVSDPKLTLKELLDLNAEMELEVGVPVDLVEMENLPETLRANVARNGIIIKSSKNLPTNLRERLKH